MKRSISIVPAPAARDRQPGGRTTTTGNGVAHMAGDGGGIQPELLTSAQAAKLAGVSERTWWAWTRSGLAPRPIHIGHGLRPACRFRRAEILRWIEDGCKPVDGREGGR